MIKHSVNSRQDQQRRLKIKNINEQMKTLAVQGTGISPWEAQVLVDVIDEVYFSELNKNEVKEGQVKYQCISADEGAGKPLHKCKMVTAVLTLFDDKDQGDFTFKSTHGMSGELRRRRIARIVEEAKEQAGYLTQEDLAKLLMCDVRTIRRDVKALKQVGIVIPTRGQQKDIGPGVSHREIAIRHWIEGKEPVAIANHIKHSVEAVESYLQKFKRVAYLRGKNFNLFDIALTVGISPYAAGVFSEIYDEFRGTAFFESRMEEINLIGGQFYLCQGEKKSSPQWKGSTENVRRQP